MDDREAFDLCLKKVRMLQSRIGSSASGWPVEELLGVHLHLGISPSDRSCPSDYIADFSITGREALKPWPARQRLFEVYFICNVPYLESVKTLSLKQGTFKWLVSLIKPAVGRQLKRKRLVPGHKFRLALKEAEEEDKKLKAVQVKKAKRK